MKHVFNGTAVAALLALAVPASALAQSAQPMPPRPWVMAYFWGPKVHAATDFMAGPLNRAVMGQIGLQGAVGLDKVALNPQPLPPKAR